MLSPNCSLILLETLEMEGYFYGSTDNFDVHHRLQSTALVTLWFQMLVAYDGNFGNLVNIIIPASHLKL